MVQSKISTKFFKIVTYIAIVILIISSFIAFSIMKNIEKDTQLMIKNQMAVKLENKINNSFKVGITNAVSISQNQQIKLALKNMDKQKAYDVLHNLTKVYANYANYENNKVHIHTHDVKSFLRSWNKDHNGDELSSFRHTINRVKKTRKPVLGIEVGYADLVIRAIVPIMDKLEYLGSLEFIQDFSSIQRALKEENKYLFSLIDTSLLKNKPKHNHIIGKYAITQKTYNDEFFNKLKTIDFDELQKQGHLNVDDYFYSLSPIIGFNDTFIGYYVVGEKYSNVQKILSQSKEIAYMFILLMVFMAFIIIIAINMTIKKLIINNLTRVTDGLSSFFSFLNKKSNTINKIDIIAQDEIGQMAKEINSNIEVITTLIDEEKKQTWITDGLQGLNKQLSGDSDLASVCHKSVTYLCEYLKAGVGALYIYNKEKEELSLYGTYAYVQRNDLSNKFKLGEGTVGQVALQKSPIQLENIQRSMMRIATGTTNELPLNTYTFPLVYQDELYGVIEIGSSLLFDKTQREFFELSNGIIATALFSSIQNKKVHNLLIESEDANVQMRKQQEQLEKSNAQMQEQQAQLEEANSQMQEQQAQLEEANAQMEEQQVQLKESEKELKKQNQELENSQKNLDKKAKDLEESNRYKSEFLANMSHELRTPLNSVILLSSMLKENKKENLSADDIKKASIINSSGEELLRLINDVLDLSKVEAGRMELVVERFHSSNFVTTLKDLFESSVENKGLEFIIEDRYNDFICNDQDKLSQVIRNFLSNSLKFTHEGYIKFVVESASNNQVTISIEDTGIGIPKDKQSVVFQAFQQVDGSTSRKYGGTGLGLSITKELVTLMGGDVQLVSQQNEGSTFSITIPNLEPNDQIGAIPEVNTTVDTKSNKTEKDTTSDTIADDTNKITTNDKPFLIIEDNETFATTLKNVINEKGELALIATNGGKGLELAHKFQNIQGILLDLGLPDIDGIDILKKLKEDVRTKKIPVYIISGRDDHNYKSFYGAVGFKQKPLSNDDLNNVFKDFSKLNDKKIKDLLVVEDNEVQREAMIEFISDDSINTFGVGTIDEAIDEIKTDKYDAIIVDLTLDGKSGLQVCEYIKKNDLTLPIIVYTGKELTQEEESKIKQYTDSIVIKTANSQNRLLEEVDMFLHRVKKSTPEVKTVATDDINFENKKIMVVDDDMRNTFVLVEILESRGAQVITATNGQEALDVLSSNSDTNIILMDVMMPVMDGYEAIERIREDEKLKDIPIIAVTAKAMNKDKERCFEVGANDYLTKPLNLDTFVGVVKAWIK
jgi:CheY-like chemotaxis protein